MLSPKACTWVKLRTWSGSCGDLALVCGGGQQTGLMNKQN